MTLLVTLKIPCNIILTKGKVVRRSLKVWTRGVTGQELPYRTFRENFSRTLLGFEFPNHPKEAFVTTFWSVGELVITYGRLLGVGYSSCPERPQTFPLFYGTVVLSLRCFYRIKNE